jgi:diketogulonate reductase-like aldo/keto reductase
VDAVKAALNIGYKHIDTAAVYGNKVSDGRVRAIDAIHSTVRIGAEPDECDF